MTGTPSPHPDPPAGGERGEIIVRVVGRSDVGRTREHNEDAFAIAGLDGTQPQNGDGSSRDRVSDGVLTGLTRELGGGAVLMVADGMGGAAAGEIASSMAVDVIIRELRQRWRAARAKASSDAEAFAIALREATSEANANIHSFATQHPEYRGMGTTATVAALLGDTLYLAQVGDSRAYLVRDGVARQITKDQSLMQKLIEAGEITVEEAEVSDRRNIILQALGPESMVKVDLTHQRVRRGDTLILCSDGLSGQVRPDEIARVATEERDLDQLCQRLIDSANATGGPDNITVVAARFEGDGLAVAATDDEVGHCVFPLGDDQTPVYPVERYVRHSTVTPIWRRSGGRAKADAATGAAAPVSGDDATLDAADAGALPADGELSPMRRPIPVSVLVTLVLIALAALIYTLLQLRR
ncbi:MAG TPA: protein phosphatase 2C domain-containing protein [Gemmatimonadaceae bacterium]|nr:protein phosphatase 2C domain-containing protein [Gemmatimonadaceae bacterium]